MSKLLLQQLVKWTLVALLALVLYGVLPAGHLAVALALFITVVT